MYKIKIYTKKIILIDISIDFVTDIKFHGKEILIMAKVIVSITDMLYRLPVFRMFQSRHTIFVCFVTKRELCMLL